MQARLVVYRNDKHELCVPVAEAGASIGRDAGSAVQLSAPEVSKRHAILQKNPQGWSIRDLGSRNGLLVNGSRVQEALLRNGDKLMIGPYTLVFELDGSPHTPIIEIDLSPDAISQTMTSPRRQP